MNAAGDLHHFWFGPLDTDGLADDAHRRRWFRPDPAFDDELARRFGPLLDALAAGDLEDWRQHPDTLVSYVLVADQLPRNLHRGTRQAFAWDALAIAAARDAVAAGTYQSLALDERAFLYMPFEHAESLPDQHLAVGLFSQLRDQSPPGRRQLTGQYLRFAHQHRDLIERFGRFPHRNALLDRPSTPAELDYLEQGTRFGQAPA